MGRLITAFFGLYRLMGKLYLLYRRNQGWREYSHMLIEENKWRAVRYGLEGSLIYAASALLRDSPCHWRSEP